jgi:hypothetical protein
LAEKMVMKKLRDKLGPTIYDKPLITLGKIVIALAAIGSILGGLIDIIQGLISLSNDGKPVFSFLWIILWGSLRIALGYGYYTLLDMRKSGLIVSIAKFFAVLGAGMMIIFSQIAIIVGLLSLSEPLLGGFLLLGGGIMFCVGLGVIYFIDERDKFQKMRKI